jgi:hypothetical protein
VALVRLKQTLLSLFATRVHTEQSVQSGESTTNYTESGVALPTQIADASAENVELD